MNSAPSARFRLDESELHASALRAQVAERSRRALNHDMNNAVQSIHSGLELLSKCLSSPGLARISPQECITLLQQQFITLQQTLNKLLSEIATSPGDPDTIDVSVLVTEALHTLRHERAVSKARLNIDAGVLAIAREVNVRSVALALILDSIDEMGEAGALEVSVHGRGKEVAIYIRSTHGAAGGPPQERTIAQVARDVLAAEGGKLEVEEEAGSRLIRIGLPAAESNAPARDRNEPASHADAVLRVLIADPNRDAADSLAMILQLEGYDAKALYNGSQLSETIGRLSPHLVLVDVDLPDCDVREVARRARSGRTGKLPMLVQVSSSERAHLGEFDAHLLRPVEWPQLQGLVKAARES